MIWSKQKRLVTHVTSLSFIFFIIKT